MAERGVLRVALAYPASLAAPLAGLVVLVASWPATLHAGAVVALVLAGLGAWTLVEYLLHRWMLHDVDPFRAWHLAHHADACAPIRVPVVFSALLVLGLVGVPALLFGPGGIAAPLSAGLVLGNMLQEAVHHRLHDTRPVGRWLEDRRRLHGFHHFHDERRGYGTLTDFWDRVFATLPPRT